MTEFPVKPVADYLINGPIPAADLMNIDFLDIYVGTVVDVRLDIHFMLEYTSVHGAPKWWQGTVSEFEQEFHRNFYQGAIEDDQEDGRSKQLRAVELLMEMWKRKRADTSDVVSTTPD